ncbi:hypothetical protein PCAR4_840148 [Paraburkholderia caribensis]|nr:hypothetical protein PCAR4_840148 [Paraburkholderia caribensis]
MTFILPAKTKTLFRQRTGDCIGKLTFVARAVWIQSTVFLPCLASRDCDQKSKSLFARIPLIILIRRPRLRDKAVNMHRPSSDYRRSPS